MKKIVFDNDRGQAIEYYLASEVDAELRRRNIQIEKLKKVYRTMMKKYSCSK